MKFIHRCWCLLIGALLSNSCSDNPTDPPTPEYGVPQATVKLDGVVVNESGTPVKDIAIELTGFGTTTSDTLGNWTLNRTGFASCVTDTEIVCGLEATDVDGPANGEYLPTLVFLDLDKTGPGSGYNLGTYEQHGIRIVMPDIGIEYGPECALRERIREETDEP